MVFVKCDVTVWSDLQELTHVSEREFGDVPDVWVAGAGIFEPVSYEAPRNPTLLPYSSSNLLNPPSLALANNLLPQLTIPQPTSNFWFDTETAHYTSVDINISHPIKLTRIAIRALLSRNKPGVVLVVSSVAGLIGSYPSALYCATKHALVGFTKSLGPADREEGVKIVCACPG